jgi:phage shock protein C
MNTGQQYRRLTKSRSDRMIDGVCGGVAAYFGVDPTLVRVAWVLGTLLGGSGIILYIAAMILMPKEAVAPVPSAAEPAADPTAPRSSARNNTRFWGILLVGVGVVWLMGNLDLDFWHHWWWLSFGTAVPVLMILAGVAFLYGGREYISAAPSAAAEPTAAAEPQAAVPPAPARLMRSRADKKISGVCGGIGNYLQIDGVIIRLAFIMAAIASFGFMLLVYLVLAIAVPLEPDMPAVETAAVS